MSLPFPQPGRPRSVTPLRTGVLWLCVLAMLAGTVDLHTLGGGHGAADLLPPAASQAGDDGTLYACADGHTPATHVEAPLVVEVHRCEACLHRQQHRDGELLAAGFLGADRRVGSVPAGDRLPAASALLEHAPSRGPPAA